MGSVCQHCHKNPISDGSWYFCDECTERIDDFIGSIVDGWFQPSTPQTVSAAVIMGSQESSQKMAEGGIIALANCQSQVMAE
jgi:hypothetical protein